MELHSKSMEEGIDSCVECENVCKKTIIHCMHHGGKHVEPEHMRIMKDCIALCRASADLMITNSPFHKEMCSLCAKACNECAEECEKFDEEFMKECAKMCRKCAQSCNEMSE